MSAQGVAAEPVNEDRHMSTGHLLSDLKGRTVSSGIVTGFAQAAMLVLNLGSVAILARLLTPQDFGLVAMVGTVMAVLRPFSDAGLSAATIQKEKVTQRQVSNLFWTNLLLGAVVMLGLIALSGPISWFYREPRLVVVTVWLSFTFLLTSAAVQHLALLNRQMRFRALAFIQVSSAVIGTLVGVTMAWHHYGYWCLVGMQVSTPAVALLLAWLACGWRPQLPSRHSETRSLLNFGANLTASRVLWSLARGSDGLLIGRFFGSEALGLYSRGTVLLNRPLEQAMAPLAAVLVPTLSRLQMAPQRYHRVLFDVYDLIAVVGFLFSGLLLALAYPMTLVVLGMQWVEAAPIFAAFTLVAVYVPLTSVAGWLLTSQGRGKDFLLLSSAASVVTIAAFLLGLRFGPVGVAMSYSISCLLVHLPLSFYIAGRRGVVSTRELWTHFFTHLPVWGVACGATWLVNRLVTDQPATTQLCVGGSVGFCAGAAFIGIYRPSRCAVLRLRDVWRDWRSQSNPVVLPSTNP